MSVYVPCGALRCEVAEDLKTIGEKCDEFDWCILGGDWNARNVRWNEKNDGVTNVNGKELAKWIDENEEVILISTKENTFRNETKLDHFVISKGMESRATLERRITGKCHDAVKMRWSIEKRELERTEYEVKKSYKNMDWADFRRRITTKLAHKVKLPKCRNISNDEIDTAIKEITEIILETESECTKRIVVRAANSVELSDEVKGLMKRRRIAITEKRRVNASEEWKEVMKEVIKETNRDIRIKIKKQQVDELSTRIKTISTKGEPFKEIRRLTGKQRRSCAEGRLKIGDTIVEGEEEKAEELARWYEEIAKEKVPDNANQIEIERKYEEVRAFKSTIKFDMDNPALEPKEEVLTNDKEMEAIRRRINNKKSSGSDGLTNHVIRKLPKYFWDCTTIMFNNCLVNGYFPKKWKTATIIPLPKTSKAEIPNDYRPISLLSNWGKCLEDVILNRLKNDEDEVVGVPAHQFAYKRGHSAVHAVDILGAEIEESRRLRMATVVIALDITKAFDSVWKKGLVYKLSNLGIEAEVKTIIADFLNERKGRVQVGKAVSREFRIERGVPQGLKLGPVLYNIYTGDFKMAINEKQGILNFADD